MYVMDCFGRQEKLIRGSVNERKLCLSWDDNLETEKIPENEMLALMENFDVLDEEEDLETEIIPENEMLALMECHVENFDALDEEEDLKCLVGKEELIINVMKSLEMEIASPRFLNLEAMNSCCLQSDSANSMGTCSSSFSDPFQSNLGSECQCPGNDGDDNGPQLGFMLSNEMFHELFEDSEFYGSELIEGMDVLQSLSRVESFSSMKELMDFEKVGVWE